MAKRILIYTNHYYPENFKVNEISSMLSEEGMDVTVVTGIPNYPDGNIHQGYGFFKKRRETVNNIKINRLLLIPRGSGSKFRLILNYLSYFISSIFYTLYISIFKKKYDVILVHHTSPIMIAITPIIYKWIRKPKMILWDLDLWPDTLIALDVIKKGRLSQFLEKIVKWVYKKYDTVLIGSESFAEKAKQRVEASKIDYFPNWAEDVFIEKKLLKPDGDLKFPDGFKIMYTGNIGEAQDFGNVFKAMLLLKDEPISWLFVGGGRWSKKLKEKIRTAGIEDKAIFYNNHPLLTMPYFFSKADLMYFSLQDKEIFAKTVPAKLQAYMAGEKAVIGMISGEGNKIIKNANCGMCVESGDFKGFAQAIKTLSQEPNLLKTYGENGLQFYQKHYAKDNRKEQLLSLINQS